MKSFSVKAKFQIGQFQSLKQIFCKFEGQFDTEGQVFEIVQDLKMINTQLKFEGKIHYGSKVVALARNYTEFQSNKVSRPI